MALGKRVAGNAPPNPDQTSIWDMSEGIGYVPAMRITELDHHTKSGHVVSTDDSRQADIWSAFDHQKRREVATPNHRIVHAPPRLQGKIDQ